MKPTVPMTDEAASLRRVREGSLCAGCGACAAIAPGKVTMAMTPPGYLRPIQTASLTPGEDAAIAAVCPGLGITVNDAGRKSHDLWGPYLETWTGWATDSDMRHAGSSGGALSMIVLHLLETGEIDAAVTNRASTEVPVANQPVVVTDRAGILDAAGSRYAPSAPLADIRAYVATGRRHAFVGKPCDVAAMRALAARDPVVAAAFPVMLSFFCAGIPSQSGAEEILSALGTTLPDTQSFRFRGNGWPGMATAIDRQGKSRAMSYNDSWGKILTRHIQHRCKICADGSGMSADIVCADAWESDENGYPVFDEREGVSLIVARTDLGKRIVDSAATAGRIAREPFEIAGLAAMQPGQRFRRRVVAARMAALRLAGRPVPRYRGLRLVAAARDGSVKFFVQNFVGMFRRILAGRM